LHRRTASVARTIFLTKWLAGFSASFAFVLAATSFLLPSSDGPVSEFAPPANFTAAPESVAGIIAAARDALPKDAPAVSAPAEAATAKSPELPRSVLANGAYAETLQVKKGDTLIDLLTRSGVEHREAVDAIEALNEVFKPQDLRPGQELTLNFRLSDGFNSEDIAIEFASLSLQPSVERDVSVTRGDDGSFMAKAIERPLEKKTVLGAAMIESSLFQAGRYADVPSDVLGEIIKAFSYDVDFQRDVQPGDAFEVIYERFEDADGRLARTGQVLYAALTLSGHTREIFGFEPKDGSAGYYNAKGESVRKALLRTPLDVVRITSKFGMRKHPVLNYTKMHKGIDFAASTGTPIFASGDGTIVKIGRNGGYGNYILLRHNGQYATAYAHMSRFAKGLKKGSKVRQGDVIGYVGSTGRSTGPHLHYEILVNGKQVNPMKIKLVGNKLAGKDLKRFEAVKAGVMELRRQLGNALLVANATPTCNGERPLESC
jgi:murein DD-endopeptidase MepM/ murein hydrolase activator NlpD